MVARRETPHRHDTELLADEFHRGSSFTNWRPQGSGDWLLIYTAAGASRVVTPAGGFTTQAGECILYAPGDYQDYGTDSGATHWHLLWCHFHPRANWHPWLSWPKNKLGVRCIHLQKGEVREAFSSAMLRLIRIFRRRLPNAIDFASNALEEALLWSHLAAARGDWVRLDPRVRKAMDYLATNVGQPFHLESLARHCGLSVSRLAHLFRSEAGLSPQRFFEQERMRNASQLLRVTGLGIGEIAAEVGYDDPFYFTNRFRRHTGKSPTHYRRSQRG